MELEVLKLKSCGLASMKLVVAVPARKSGWRRTFSKKRMFVRTPLMWNYTPRTPGRHVRNYRNRKTMPTQL